ncbi:DUF6387 family protein [Shewanella algae]|uniref:DUF6387 family protein n=1 Tax=Shewanella algae TaxID=38313 RepID=UPI0031F5A0A4
MSSPTSKVEKVTNESHRYWPDWFDLENYKCLETLSAKQFIIELQERLTLLHCPCDSKGRRLTDDRKWRAIKRGDVLLGYTTQESPDCEAVRELNAADIEALYQDFLISNGLPIEPDYLFPSNGKGIALLAIDLANADDALLLSNFTHFINQVRARDKIEEPKFPRLAKANIKSFKKLLFYKAIPYMDLMLYCHNALPNDKYWQPLEFSLPMLSKLLLNDAVEAEKFKKTYKSFYNKLIGDKADEQFLAMLFSAIRNDKVLANTQVKNL